MQTIIIAPIELLILQSFIDGSFGTLHNGGTWFISCLLLCYFLFPLFKEILTKIKKKKCLIFLFLYFIAFLSPVAVKIYNASSIYSNPFFRFFEFLIGMLIADLVIKNAEKVKKYQVVFVLVELLLLIIGVSILKKSILFENNYTMYNIIVIPLFALLLYNSSQIKNRFILKISGSSFVQYLSKISFAFFMAQFFSFAFTRQLLELSWFGDITNIKMILTAIIINLVLAILMYEIIEKPLSKVLLLKRMIGKA